MASEESGSHGQLLVDGFAVDISDDPLGKSAMTAQPASSIPKWSGNYFFGNEALIGMPEYGSLVSAVIAGWSITEAHLGRSFAALPAAVSALLLHPFDSRLLASIKGYSPRSRLSRPATWVKCKMCIFRQNEINLRFVPGRSKPKSGMQPL